MTAGIAWMAAFPLAQADSAVKALLRSWEEMASKPRRNFSPKVKEPTLTRVVRAHIRKKIAPEMKLLGHWGTEGVENDVDFETGEILDEGRTDIEYTWNNESTQLELVFEFKKLTSGSQSRRRYLEDGVMRFVTGVYSDKQPVALMVGILLASEAEAVSGLRRNINLSATAAAIHACANGDGRFVLPPVLFPERTTFDTEHLRDREKAPPHGTIRIAHVFVEFPYAVFPDKKSKRKARLAAEAELGCDNHLRT